MPHCVVNHTLSPSPFSLCVQSSSVVKVGTWGGDGGSPCDIMVAPQRLESVTIRWGKVIDWIAFSYRDSDGKTHTAGPWGGNGRGEGTETVSVRTDRSSKGSTCQLGSLCKSSCTSSCSYFPQKKILFSAKSKKILSLLHPDRSLSAPQST